LVLNLLSVLYILSKLVFVDLLKQEVWGNGTIKQDYISELSLCGHIDVFNMMVLVLYTFVMVFIIDLTVNGKCKYIVLYITGHKKSFNVNENNDNYLIST
jgi:hypothetical protein